MAYWIGKIMEDLEAKLVQEKWIEPMDLISARQEAVKDKKSIWAACSKLGFLSEEDIALFFSGISNIPYIKITDYDISPEVLSIIGEEFCRDNLVIPVFRVRNTLFVACSNPLDTALIDNLVKICNCDIEPLIASGSSIDKILDYYYGPAQSHFRFEEFIMEQNTVRGLGFWRESERLELKMGVNLVVEDKSVVLHHSSSVQCQTINISRNGKAVGLLLFLFLPKGIKVSLEFIPKDEQDNKLKAKGEIVHSHMEKGQRYFFGVKFTEIEEETKNKLISFAVSK